MNINAQSDTPFLLPWWYLGDRVGPGQRRAASRSLVSAIGSRRAFLWLPATVRAGAARARRRRLLPDLAAPLQLWTHSFPPPLPAAHTTGIGDRPAELDRPRRRPRCDVDARLDGDNPYRLAENEFWNRSVRHVYHLGLEPLLAGASEQMLTRAGGNRPLSRPDRQPGARAVRAHRPDDADRRDARRRRPGPQAD